MEWKLEANTAFNKWSNVLTYNAEIIQGIPSTLRDMGEVT